MSDTHENVLPQGRYEEHKRKLSEERKIKCNDILRQTDEYRAAMISANETDAAKLQHSNRTSSETKQLHHSNRTSETTQPDSQFPYCIGDRRSYLVQRRRKQWNDVDIKPYKLEKTTERNNEAQSETSGGVLGENRLSEGTSKSSNSFPAATRQRWIIPDYEEILKQKRAQESNYRRANGTVVATDIRVQEVSDSMSDINKQVLKSEYNGDELKQNEEILLAKRKLAVDTAPRHDQTAPDSRSMRRRYQDHNLTFVQPCLDTGSSLDPHYGLLLGPVRQMSLHTPPGLYYQPATYVTDKSAPNPDSVVNEAYSFYASHNPLDPDLNAEASHVLGHTLHLDSFMRQQQWKDTDAGSMWCPDIPGSGLRQMSIPHTGEAGLGKWRACALNEGKSSHDKITSAELSELVCDSGPCSGANIRSDRCDFTWERDKNYDPFGRDNSAQLKNQHESSKPDVCPVRHNLNNSQENIYLSNGPNRVDDTGNASQAIVTERDYLADTASGDKMYGRGGNASRAIVTERDYLTDTASGDKMYGRGGSGMFGTPVNDAQKIQAEKYMADLKKQIEEKRAVQCKKMEQKRLEEEREQKILNEQRVQMQKEYEEEQRRTKEKAEEAKLKNEEIVKAAEERKRETDRKDREAEKEREEKQEERELELKEREKDGETRSRARSPLIPTLRDKRVKEQENAPVVISPLTTIDTVEEAADSMSVRQESRQDPNTEGILTQLAKMRAYLRSEHTRLQALLDTQDEVISRL